MNLIPTILLVLSSSIDSFIVSVAYGTKNIRIGFFSNLLIGVVCALGTYLSMLFGSILINIFSINTTSFLGALILFLLSLYFIYDYRKNKNEKNNLNIYNTDDNNPTDILKYPEIADKDKSGSIEIKESFMLALALTLNNFALGTAASISGFNIYLTTILAFIFSFILIPLGSYLSKKVLSKIIGDKGSLISGLIILILSLIQFYNIIF